MLHFLLLLLLLHCAISAIHHFLHTPSAQISCPSELLRPPLLETRPQQGSMVKYLRIRGCEPLRSAHRLFGLIVCSCFVDPGRRPVVGPSCGPFCHRDPVCVVAPGSFLGRYLTTVHHHRGATAIRLITAAFARAVAADVSGAVGMGQATSLVAHPIGDLQALDERCWLRSPFS